MAGDYLGREVSPLVGLFQRAHGRVSALNKLDEQIAVLSEQRRKLQDEVRAIQVEINNEFDRVMRSRPAGARAERTDRVERTERAERPTAEKPGAEKVPVNGDGLLNGEAHEGPSVEDLSEAIALEALGTGRAELRGEVPLRKAQGR